MPRASVLAFSLAVPALLLGLVGCSAHVAGTGGVATGTATAAPPTPTPSTGTLKGIVHGGQQPVSGSTIQLYAAGATSATALLTSPVSSDGNGGFDITGLYTCPGGDPLVYLSGTGGNPGAGTNPKLSMMVLLGHCSALKTMSFVTINEVTSVAAVVSAPQNVQSATTVTYGSNLAGLAAAMTTASEVANPATGTPGGPALPAGEGVSASEVNTLANIMAACVNSTGGSSGDGSACGTLFQATGGGDTLTALLAAINNPTTNASVLCNLAAASSPFQPQIPDCGTGSSSNAPPGSLPLPTPLLQTPAPQFTASEALNVDGDYNLGTKITITDSTAGAAIYYTVNNTTPTKYSTPYTSPVAIPDASTGLVLCAIATVAKQVDGTSCEGFSADTLPVTFVETGSPTYSFGLGGVVIIPYGSPMLNPTNPLALANPLSIVPQTSGSSIYYILNSDGTAAPSTNSTPYSGPINLTAGETLAVMAQAPSRAPSPSSEMLFQVRSPNPTFSPVSGAYPSGTVVTMADAQPDVDIHYTTDGSIPTSASPKYGGAITLTGSARFLAMIVPPEPSPSPSPSPNTVAPYVAPSGYFEADYAIAPYTGVLSLVAGDYANGTMIYGYTGASGNATSTALARPSGVAVDGNSGTLYIADTGNNCVRAVSDGVTTDFAGVCGAGVGYGGDGGEATAALFNGPTGVAVDSTGKVYIADRGNSCIRVVSGGKVSVFAGVCQTSGANYISGPATSTFLNNPEGVTVDSSDNVYIADTFNSAVRRVFAGSGSMDTIAGQVGTLGSPGDGVDAPDSKLGYPVAIAIDTNDNFYISDGHYNMVYRIDGNLNTISVVTALGADLIGPEGVATDASGNLYVADTGHSRVLKVTPGGVVSTYAGAPESASYGGYGGPAAAAWIGGAAGLAMNSSGDLYITTYADPGSSVVMVHH